jgi:hypothetical protein
MNTAEKLYIKPKQKSSAVGSCLYCKLAGFLLFFYVVYVLGRYKEEAWFLQQRIELN